MSTDSDTSTGQRPGGEDKSLRNFFVPFLVVSVIVIAIMAVVEQTAG